MKSVPALFPSRQIDAGHGTFNHRAALFSSSMLFYRFDLDAQDVNKESLHRISKKKETPSPKHQIKSLELVATHLDIQLLRRILGSSARPPFHMDAVCR